MPISVTVGSSSSTTSNANYSHAIPIMHPSIAYSTPIANPLTAITHAFSTIAHCTGSTMIVSYSTLVSTLKIERNSHLKSHFYSLEEILMVSHLCSSLNEISSILSNLYHLQSLSSTLNLSEAIMLTSVTLNL